MNESREEFDYSLDDDFDESVVSGKGGISPSSKNRFMNKQLEGLNEKSVDSYSNDFDGVDQVKGSESLHEKSYLSEYTQDFNSPVEKDSTGSNKEKEYHTQSKVDSEPSNEYQDDFLQEKSSVLLDENTPITTMNNLPSALEIDQLPKENSIDYGEDFFEGSLKEEEEAPKAPESEQKEDDITHHSVPIPAPIVATKSGDSVGNLKSGDNYDDFLSISAYSPMADALKSRSLDPPQSLPPSMQPEELNATLFETTMDSGLFPNYSPSPTATSALVPDATVEPSIMKPKLSPKTSVLHLQELIKDKEDLFAPLPDDHSSIGSNQEKTQINNQIDNHVDGEVEGGEDERRNSASYDASFEEKTSLAQLVNDPIDEDNSLYLLEDEEEVKKQEAKEEQLLQEYSDFVRRSSEASLYKTDSSNFFKSSKTITSPLPVTEEEEDHDQASLVSNLKEGSSLILPEKEKISDEIKREEEGGEENKESDKRVEEEEDDAILRDSALLMSIDPRPESPETIELKNNLTEEGINRVKRLSENFMDNVFHHSSKTSPRDEKALKDLEESVKVSEEQIRAIKEETNSLSDHHSLNPPVQQSSVPPSPAAVSEFKEEKDYENDLEEDDKPFVYPKRMFEEEEEEFIYPADPDLSTNHVSPLKPSNQTKNRTAPKSQKTSKNPLLDSLERYEAPPAKSAGTSRPPSSSATNSNPNSSRRASSRPNSSSQKVNQLRNTVETNRKASVREILAASTTPVAQIKKSKISSEQLSAQRMKEFVLSKPNNPLRFNVAENCLVLTEVCIHRKNFQRCSSMFCQEAFKKYQWMKLMRKKSALAIELLESADELWKKKLDQSLEEAVESLTEEQENEVITQYIDNPFYLVFNPLF